MNDKVIWSTNGTRDYITGLGDEEKFNALVDRGYDPEMLGGAENIDNVIKNDDYMWQDDVEDFENRILPMINAQTKNGIVVMCNGEECKAVNAEDLIGGDVDPSINNVEIVDDGEGLVWVGNGINGEKKYDLRVVPEDVDMGMFMPEFDGDVFTLDDVREYSDLPKIAQNLPRLTNNGIAESCNKINEAKTNNKEELANELEEIKPLADEYGFEYFTSMPLTAFEGDPESVEYQYPEFFKVCKAFFKEMGIVDDVNDADALEENWYAADEHDFNTIVKTCDLMIKHDNGSQQIEKVYKDGFDDGLGSDDDIKAAREPQEESLQEAKLPKLYSTEIDVAIEADSPEELIAELDAPKGINVEVVEMEGPGGGWPLVRLTGDEALVKQFLADAGFDEGLTEDTETVDDSMFDIEPENQSDEELAAELADAYSLEYDGTPESEQTIYDDILQHYEDPDYAELVIEILKNNFEDDAPVEEAIDPKDPNEGQTYLDDLVGGMLRKNDKKKIEVEEFEDTKEDRLLRAAKKYRNYSGLLDDDEINEDLSEYAANRVCYEEGLSMDELKGALGK